MPKFDVSLIPSTPDLIFEKQLWLAGCPLVAGLDEAGRGALAGPVSAGAVILALGSQRYLDSVRDSKQLTPQERLIARSEICQAALAWGVGFASAQEIDCLGILPATRLALSRALDALYLTPDHLLLDCLFLPEVALPQTSLTKGDQRSLSIAAASILAKTARDAVMEQLDVVYAGYDFGKHKGYGTVAHRAALVRLGLSPAHRCSFRLRAGD
jgi:ribonuclease HII